MSAAYANDKAALQGAVAYLMNAGAGQVDFHSTGCQCTTITGGTGTLFASNPDWVAGFSSAKSATSGCTAMSSYAGGKILLTQYVTNGFDADHHC